MSVVTMLTRQAPIIGSTVEGEGGIEFDAQISHQFTATASLSEYAVETGANVTQSLIQAPTTVTMELGVGDEPLISWGGIAAAAGASTAGALASVVGSIGVIAADVVNAMLIGSNSRGGSILSSLLHYKETGKMIVLVIPHIGTLPNMVITSIEHVRNYETGAGNNFTVTLTQVRLGSSVEAQAAGLKLRAEAALMETKSAGSAAIAATAAAAAATVAMSIATAMNKD